MPPGGGGARGRRAVPRERRRRGGPRTGVPGRAALAIRQQEATRREFVDDLLAGGGERAALEQRAADFGFNASGAHTVLVVRAERPLRDAGPVQGRVENQVQSRFGRRDVIVATKDGLLVCIFPSRAESPDPAHELAGFLSETATGSWQVGVGRPGSGLGGVVRSYREAREALDLAERLGVADPIVRVDGVMAFRLLAGTRRASPRSCATRSAASTGHVVGRSTSFRRSRPTSPRAGTRRRPLGGSTSPHAP